MLNTLINAAENNLPALIKQHIRPDFDCIYNDIYIIEELLTMSAMIKTDEDKSGKNGADCYSKNGHAVTVLTRQS